MHLVTNLLVVSLPGILAAVANPAVAVRQAATTSMLFSFIFLCLEKFIAY